MAAAEAGTDVFGAIAAPTRREILALLTNGALPVSQIAESFNMSLSAVSQHLAVLKDARLVQMSKSGKQRIYRINPDPLLDVVEWLNQYEQFWPAKLDRLEKHLERKHE
jgi:DNA-binding transcriptional ArsR family regulator